MALRIDMHIHTIASDGMFTAKEAVAEASRREVSIFSISDHDSIKSVSAAMEMAKSQNMLLVPAMEATTKHMGLEIHILGYGFNMADPEILEFINNTAIIRYDREIAIIKAAMKAFDGLSLSEFHEFSKRDFSGGFASLNYLVDKGKIADIREFGELMKQLMPDYKDSFYRSEDAVGIMKSAGAVTVLAHPSYHFPKSVMGGEMLKSFRDMGIDGIECRSPYNPEEDQIEYYEAYAKANGMCRSAGSDCHGAYLSRQVGTPYADTDNTNILELLEGKGLGVARFLKQSGVKSEA